MATKDTNTSERVQSLFLTVLLIASAVVGVTALSGTVQADAAGNTQTLQVGADAEYDSVQAAVDDAESGDRVEVYPGTYEESAMDRSMYGGTSDIGLYVGTDDITIVGVDENGDPITDHEDVAATIVSQANSPFGTNGAFVSGDDVTIRGLEIQPDPDASPNKNVEVVGDGFRIENSVVDGAGSIYFATGDVQSFHVQDTTLSGSLTVNNGAGNQSSASERVVRDSEIGSIGVQGAVADIPWLNTESGVLTIRSTTVRNGVSAIGTTTSSMDWSEILSENTFPNGATLATTPDGEVRSYDYTIDADYNDDSEDDTITNVREITTTIQGSVQNAQSGDTVTVRSGTYEESVGINKPVTLKGVDRPTIEGRIDVRTDGVTVRGVEITNPGVGSGSDEVEAIFVGNANGWSDQSDESVIIEDVVIDGVKPGESTKTVEGIHVKSYTSEDGPVPIDGVEIKDVLIEDVSQPDAGADGLKLQADVRNVDIQNLAVNDVEGKWAYGVVATPSSKEQGVPASVQISKSSIRNVNGIDYLGNGVGIDGKPANGFASADEVSISETTFENNGRHYYVAKSESEDLQGLLESSDGETPSIIAANTFDNAATVSDVKHVFGSAQAAENTAPTDGTVTVFDTQSTYGSLVVDTEGLQVVGEGQPTVDGWVDMAAADTTLDGFEIAPGRTYTAQIWDTELGKQGNPYGVRISGGADKISGIEVVNNTIDIAIDSTDGTAEARPNDAKPYPILAQGIQLFAGGASDDIVIANNDVTATATGPTNGAGAEAIKIQGATSGIVVTGNDVVADSTGYAFGIAATSEGETGQGTVGPGESTVVRRNNITATTDNENTDLFGVGVWAPTGTSTVNLNNFQETDEDIYGPEGLDAIANYYADGEPDVLGNPTVDPYLTTPQQNVDDMETTQAFQHDVTVPVDDGLHAVAFPGPVQGTVSDVIGEAGVENVYAYDAESGEFLSGAEVKDRQVSALDAFLIDTKAQADAEVETIRIDFAYANAGDDETVAPSAPELQEGWNFVGAPQAGEVQNVYALGEGTVGQVLNTVSQPDSQPYGVETGPNVAIENGDPVSPYEGYWVFVNEDTQVPATVTEGVTRGQVRDAVNGDTRIEA